MNRASWISLIGITALTIAGLVYTFAAGNEPVLGIELQGGASVVLQPIEPPQDGAIEQAIEIIRARVDALGVSEPEISRQGDAILVELPGVKDTEKAIEAVGATAKLEFRPVLESIEEFQLDLFSVLPPDDASTTIAGSDTAATATTAAAATATTAAATATTAAATATTAAATATTAAVTTTAGSVPTSTVAESTQSTDDNTSTSTVASTSTITSEAGPTTTAALVDNEAFAAELQAAWELSDPTIARAEDAVVYAGYENPDDENEITTRYRLGPAQLDGDAIEDANATSPNFADFVIFLDIKSGEPNDQLNALAAECFNGLPSCPTGPAGRGRLGITLDGRVEFAGAVQAPSFDGTVTLSGNYGQDEAEQIELALRYGALPLSFEDPTSREVSATIGQSALDAGIIAGLIGLGLVAIFIIGYYRILGLVAMASLGISGGILWTIISWLGESRGLTLTLAGITGLIVSIGVSVDSNIVYFEHLREDVRNGRTPRSAVDRAFPVAFSTIVKADMASLIGAALLYFLTTGAVRGFAFYLGIATLLDLVATYFFMRPAVKAITRSDSFDENPGRWGVPPRRVPTTEGGAV